jgi:hypothetical protein
MNKRLLLILLATACCASDKFSVGAYLHNRFHPNIVQERDIEGLDAHIVDNRLVLNIQVFLELLLKNSTDIRLSQLDVYNAADSVTAAKAPFDPQLILSFNTLRSTQPEPSQISGAGTLDSLSQTSQATFSQVIGSGPTVSASFNAIRSSNNSAFSVFNPNISDSLNFQITQPLLQGRGNLQLRAPLLIARTQLVITSKQSQSRIADTMSNAASQYWPKNPTITTSRRSNSAHSLASTSFNPKHSSPNASSRRFRRNTPIANSSTASAD